MPSNLLFAAASAGAVAAGSTTMVLVMQGRSTPGITTNDGPDPKFLVEVNGAAGNVLRTVTAQEAQNQTQTFTVTIEQPLASIQSLGVVFTNDFYEAASGTDRNLRVYALTVNGVSWPVNLSKFTRASDGVVSSTNGAMFDNGRLVWSKADVILPGVIPIGVTVTGQATAESDLSGPNPRFRWRLAGNLVGDPIEVTARKSANEQQRFTYDWTGEGSALTSVGIEFVNYFRSTAQGAVPRELTVISIDVAGVTYAVDTKFQRVIFNPGGANFDDTDGNGLLWRNGYLVRAAPFDSLSTGTPGGNPTSPPPPTTSPPPPSAGIRTDLFRLDRARLPLLDRASVPFTRQPSAPLRQIYVHAGSSNANNNNSGTLQQPLATLEAAVGRVKSQYPNGGTEIVVRGKQRLPQDAGIRVDCDGQPSNWNWVTGFPGEYFDIEGMSWQIFQPLARYLVVQGIRVNGSRAGYRSPYTGQVMANQQQYEDEMNARLTLRTADGWGSGSNIYMNSRDRANFKGHHVILRDIITHTSAGAGLQTSGFEYYLIEDCLAALNAHFGIYGFSGFSIARPERSGINDNDPFRIVVRRNVAHNNIQYRFSYGINTNSVSDGNGFIFDIYDSYENYHQSGHKTLAHSNLSFFNGASGLHAIHSPNIYFINNTCWANNQLPAKRGGHDMYAGFSSDNCVMQNNIIENAWGQKPIGQVFSSGLQVQSNIMRGARPDFFDGQSLMVNDTNFVNPTSNPATADFRLKTGSPALGRALGPNTAPTDLYLQVKSPKDAGAIWTVPVVTSPPPSAPPPPPTTSPPTTTPPPPPGPTGQSWGPATLLRTDRPRLAPYDAANVPWVKKPVFLRDIFVDINRGVSGAVGDEARPLRTLADGLARAKQLGAGTLVHVRAGIYDQGGSTFAWDLDGNPGAWTGMVGYQGERPEIRGRGWDAHHIRASYHLCAGFWHNGTRVGYTSPWTGQVIGSNDQFNQEAQARIGNGTHEPSGWDSSTGIGISGGTRGGIHHVIVRDLILTDWPGSGLGSDGMDYVLVEDCLATRNCYWMGWGGTGFSIFGAWDTGAVADGEPHRIVVRRCASFRNKQLKNTFGRDSISDGNGFQFDVFKSQHDYRRRSLITACLAFENGGSGMHSTSSGWVDYVGNTAWHNCQVHGTAEIWAGWDNAETCAFISNIAVSKGNEIPIILEGNGGVPTARNNVVNRALAFANTGGVVTASPGFVRADGDPAVADFSIVSNSPAIGKGDALAPTDIFGRTKTPRDVGAIWYVPVDTNLVWSDEFDTLSLGDTSAFKWTSHDTIAEAAGYDSGGRSLWAGNNAKNCFIRDDELGTNRLKTFRQLMTEAAGRGSGPFFHEVGPASSGGSGNSIRLRAHWIPPAIRSDFRFYGRDGRPAGNPKTNNEGYAYASGSLFGNRSHSRTYGYYEYRFKIHKIKQGQMFAVWLLRTDLVYPPEIDVNETFWENPLRIHMTVHGEGPGGSDPYEQVVFEPAGGLQGVWHTLGFEWTASRMKFYTDDILKWDIPNFVDAPMYTLITYEVGGAASGSEPVEPNIAADWPAEIEFDYVRIYASKP